MVTKETDAEIDAAEDASLLEIYKASAQIADVAEVVRQRLTQGRAIPDPLIRQLVDEIDRLREVVPLKFVYPIGRSDED